MSGVLYAVGTVLVFFLLFVFPFVAARWVVQRFGGRPRRPGSRASLSSPKCGSGAVVRPGADRVSPFPAYSCAGCGLHMRPPGTTAFYAAVLALSLALVPAFAYPLWSGDDGEVAVFPFMLVVAAYSTLQLRRPTPRETRTPGERG